MIALPSLERPVSSLSLAGDAYKPQIEVLQSPDASPAATNNAFAQIYKDFVPQLTDTARLRLGSEAMAEDVTQETMLNLWKARARVDPDQPLRHFVNRMHHNRIIDEARRAKSRPFPVELDVNLESADARANVADQALSNVALQEIVNFVAGLELPEPQIEAWFLGKLMGYTHVEIARRQNVPLGTAKGRLRLAHKAIQAAYEASGFDGNALCDQAA